uniref:Uncharacterized protein n=1 Tax=Chenopodium quinoa TaxID=63459 RepID=A0A803MFL8_CHEQI
MLKFAQILHFKYGFHITFLNTHYFHQTLFQSTSQNDTFSSKGNSKITFKFESILNDSNDLTSGVNSVIDETLAPLLKEVLVKLGSKDNYSKSLSCDDDPPLPPTVSCMVYDVAVSKITLDVAEEMGIPAVGLDVISACGILGYLQDRQLLDKEIIPLKAIVAAVKEEPLTVPDNLDATMQLLFMACTGDLKGLEDLLDGGTDVNSEGVKRFSVVVLWLTVARDSSCLTNGYLETTIDWIPSLKGIRLKNLPTTFRATNPNDRCLNYVSSYLKKALESKAIILNTFDALEKDVLEDLSSFSPNIYAVGPFDLLLDKIIKDVDENDHIHRPNTEEDNCDYMQWLDSQEPNSVLYISFGTVVQLTEEQFDELAWGLANSQAKFFWIVRPDQVSGRSNTLPLGYEDEVKHRGIFATWCDQKKVLAHPSIGGFVTQRGWNSEVEARRLLAEDYEARTARAAKESQKKDSDLQTEMQKLKDELKALKTAFVKDKAKLEEAQELLKVRVYTEEQYAEGFENGYKTARRYAFHVDPNINWDVAEAWSMDPEDGHVDEASPGEIAFLDRQAATAIPAGHSFSFSSDLTMLGAEWPDHLFVILPGHDQP